MTRKNRSRNKNKHSSGEIPNQNSVSSNTNDEQILNGDRGDGCRSGLEKSAASPKPALSLPVKDQRGDSDSSASDQKDSGTGDQIDSGRQSRKEMKIDEKLEALDGLSKASPSGLLAQLALLSNKAKPEYVTKIEKDPETSKFSINLTARYCDLKVTVPKIPGKSEKFARRVGADLILEEIYNKDCDTHSEQTKEDGDNSSGLIHELDPHTEQIKEDCPGIEISRDHGWYVEKEKEAQKLRDKKVDRMLNRLQVNDKLSEEERAKRTAKFEAWRNPIQHNLDYDDVYRKFDHPYFRVLCNVIRRVGWRMKCKITKTVNGVQVEVGKKGEKRTKAKEEDNESSEHSISEEGSRGQILPYVVNLSILDRSGKSIKKDTCYNRETETIKEAKSEAAYNVLKEMLVSGELRYVGKLDGRFPEKFNRRRNGRFSGGQHYRSNGYRGNNYNRNRRGGSRQNASGNGNGNGSARGGGTGRFRSKSGGNKSNERRNASNKKSNEAFTKNQPGASGDASSNAKINPGQTLMMPVTQNSKGQYVIMENAQPMVMQPAHGNAGGPAPAKKKKRSNRRNRQRKEVDIVNAADGIAGITSAINNVAIIAN